MNTNTIKELKTAARKSQRDMHAAQAARDAAADNQDAAFNSLATYAHGDTVDAVTAQSVQTAWTAALAASNGAWKVFTAAEQANAAAWEALSAASIKNGCKSITKLP